jgi:hypothetical protein
VHRLRRATTTIALAAAAALLLGATAATSQSPGAARSAVRLAVSFDTKARLNQPTAINTALRIDLRRQPSPVASVSLRYPAALGVTTSGLGIEPCRRRPADFAAVVIELTSRVACPYNSLLGIGSAVGEIRMDGRRISREVGTISLHSGPLVGDRLRLVALVDGMNPIGARLAYSGEVRPAPKPYGGDLTLHIRPLPDGWRASIALSKLDVAIGSPRIVYRDRSDGTTTRYRPDGILLPARCPAGGFPFAVTLRFEDGRRTEASARAACPR